MSKNKINSFFEKPCFYIDTRPGRAGLFSPPELMPATLYIDWLVEKHQRSLGAVAEYNFGLAQRVLSMLNQQQGRGAEVFVYGPHAGAAITALQTITGGNLQMEVLDNGH